MSAKQGENSNGSFVVYSKEENGQYKKCELTCGEVYAINNESNPLPVYFHGESNQPVFLSIDAEGVISIRLGCSPNSTKYVAKANVIFVERTGESQPIITLKKGRNDLLSNDLEKEFTSAKQKATEDNRKQTSFPHADVPVKTDTVRHPYS